MLRRREYARVTTRLLGIGLLSASAGALLRASRMAMDRMMPGVSADEAFFRLTNVWEKHPPGPTYLLFFGGVGMCLMAGTLELWRRGFFPWAMQRLATIGRASLLVFVLQTYVYSVVIASLNLRHTSWWPLLFALTVGVFSLAAEAWDRWNCSRYLTVGLPAMLALARSSIGVQKRTVKNG
jgi:hypothetical protein